MEVVHFRYLLLKMRKKNRAFTTAHPTVSLPPPFYIYETYGLDYHNYYYGGQKTAEWIATKIREFSTTTTPKILDWGCGSGRVLRHLPTAYPSGNVFGADYNANYVAWCQQHLTNCEVVKNDLVPPIRFEDSFFDAVYSISIFTHLSETNHERWMGELSRLTKSSGVVIISTHGKSFLSKLSTEEQQRYLNGQLVVHSYKVEGNRLYAAYQPPKYFQKLAIKHHFQVLEHLENPSIKGRPQQDIWILRKI